MLTVGDIFAGVGGFSLGLERAGMQTRWFAEVDPFASAVLRKHWPGVPNHGDVRSVRAGSVECVDVICGGFPCQDISIAGSGRGLEGERSGLWREMRRIVGDLRPRYALVENVGALTSRGLAVVLGDLAEIGYDAEWHIVPAAAVDAPHLRERCWIVAVDADAALERVERRRPDRLEVTFAPALARLLGRDDAGAGWRDGPPVPAIRRMDDGLPTWLVRGQLAALGNAVVPAIVEIFGRAIVEHARLRSAS